MLCHAVWRGVMCCAVLSCAHCPAQRRQVLSSAVYMWMLVWCFKYRTFSECRPLQDAVHSTLQRIVLCYPCCAVPFALPQCRQVSSSQMAHVWMRGWFW